MNLFITLRGIELELEGRLCRAEPDVGIMADYLEFEVKSPPEASDWNFTPDEIAEIDKAAADASDDDFMSED